MKLRHAAALALVVYMMLPQIYPAADNPQGWAIGPFNQDGSPKLSGWEQVAFDTAEECRAALASISVEQTAKYKPSEASGELKARILRDPDSFKKIIQVQKNQGLCIASDDPRLNEK